MDFNANLIDKVSSCEPIYNQYHPDHKNRVVLENLWTSIAASLDSTGSLSGNSYVFIISGLDGLRIILQRIVVKLAGPV